MANKLLKALENIESGRLNCINALKGKRSQIVNINSSFDDIAYAVEDLHIQNPVGIDIPYIEDIRRYTKETDPHLWHRPADWPDYTELFDDTQMLTKYDLDWYPCGFVLIKNDENNSSNFRVLHANSGKNCDNLQDGDIIFGSYYSASYKMGFLVQTNDGGEYYTMPDVYQDSSFVHSWNSSQDIIVGEDHYRWIKIYKHFPSGTSVASPSFDFTKINAVEVILCEPTFGSVNVPLTTEHLIRYNSQLASSKELESTSSLGLNYNNSNNLTCYRKSNVRCLETGRTSALWTTCNKLDTLILLDGKGITASFLPTFVLYCKAKYFAWFEGMGSSETNDSIKSNVRYIEITDPEYQAEHYSSVKGISGFPDLLEENFTQYITSFVTDSSKSNYIGNTFLTKDEVYLANLESMQTTTSLSTLYRSVIDLPKYQASIDGTLANNPALKKYKPRHTVNQTNSTTLKYPATCLYLDLSAIVSSSATFLNGSSSITYNSTILYVDMHNLETFTSSNPYNYLGGLRRLQYIKLKEGFLYNIGLPSPYLTHECAVDILTDCGTQTDGQTHYIKFNSFVYSMLTDEEKNIAVNKGWTVTT